MKKLRNKFALVAALVALTVTSGCAQVAYTTNPPPIIVNEPQNVLYVATNGNDTTAVRGQIKLPYATIRTAVSAALPGDKVQVGSGNFTNAAGVTLLNPGCKLFGMGTNSTFVYNGLIWCNTNNELANFFFSSDNDGSGTTSTSGGAIDVKTNNYVHDLVVVSANKCLSGAPAEGYNVYSNCVFITGDHGAIVQGTDYFFNCLISKTNNTSSSSSYLLSAVFNSAIYWSGGSLISLTNATGQPTNNCGIFHGSTSSGTQNFYIQNATISVPTGGYDVFGKSGVTNFVLNATYTQTNSAAINVPFAGFANTNSAVTQFVPAFPVPTTNAPVNLTNAFWLH